MSGFTKIAKATKQLTGIKITPALKEVLQKNKVKVVAHTYSGEYFPLYKNEPRKVRSSNEYQAHW